MHIMTKLFLQLHALSALTIITHGFVTITKKSRQIGMNRYSDEQTATTTFIATRPIHVLSSSKNEEEWSDFDDFVGTNSINNNSNDDEESFADFIDLLNKKSGIIDLTGCQTRLFSLGTDLVLSNYIGSMSFDEVTDWEYYYPSEIDVDDRKVVQPNPLDSNQPRRTRKSSGSVIRIFRGEFVGQIGGIVSAQGLDKRVVVKEFSGTMALSLARSELTSIGRMQSDLMTKIDNDIKSGIWIQIASSRSTNLRKDNSNVISLTKNVGNAPFLGILGEVNLAEVEDNFEANDFYRALGVPPPKPGAVWVVYEYAGLSTIETYAIPAEIRRSRIPAEKTFFGRKEPPKLPEWKQRADFVMKGIIKQSILAVAAMHESGVVHRSLGRTSLIISNKAMDKRDSASPFNTNISQLRIKLADFGFSGLFETSTSDEGFCTRAKLFNLDLRKGDNNLLSTNFAIAEDMHAVGLIFLGLLLSSLAELPDKSYTMPATDDESLQRLLVDIFDKDVNQFREYVEAEDIWSKLVELLDNNEGAGWRLLETLILAREKVAKERDSLQIFTIRSLLANPIFN